MSDSTTTQSVVIDISERQRRQRIQNLPNIKSTAPDPSVIALKEYTQSHQDADPFKGMYQPDATTSFRVIEPTYNVYALIRLPNENSSLRPCIDAMVVNIDGNGHRWMYVGPEGQEESRPARAEKELLEQLFDKPNEDYSFQELRVRLRRDLETCGNAYIEVGRDSGGKVTMMAHLPAYTMRMTSREKTATTLNVDLPRGKEKTAKIKKKFRRYIQIVGDSTDRIWFKEYGDPRRVDPATGQVKDSLSLEDSANEVLHLSLYTPGQAYGLPRWFSQLPSVLGNRQAELTNLDFFKENGIPAMVLLVSGGLVTEESISALESHFQNARGRASMNRIAVVEVGGDPATAPESGAIPVPRVELKPLAAERQSDALFLEYEKTGADKIRSAFRIPPIFLGVSDDYTYATARASSEVAEAQVFGPERQLFDEIINQKVVSTYKTKFWKFRSQPPRISAREELIRAISGFERVGALTPNVAIGLANEYFDLEIKPVTDPWGDYPFTLVNLMVQTGQINPDTIGDLGMLFAPVPDEDPEAGTTSEAPPNAPGRDPVDPEGNDTTQVGKEIVRAVKRTLRAKFPVTRNPLAELDIAIKEDEEAK